MKLEEIAKALKWLEMDMDVNEVILLIAMSALIFVFDEDNLFAYFFHYFRWGVL